MRWYNHDITGNFGSSVYSPSLPTHMLTIMQNGERSAMPLSSSLVDVTILFPKMWDRNMESPGTTLHASQHS